MANVPDKKMTTEIIQKVVVQSRKKYLLDETLLNSIDEAWRLRFWGIPLSGMHRSIEETKRFSKRFFKLVKGMKGDFNKLHDLLRLQHPDKDEPISISLKIGNRKDLFVIESDEPRSLPLPLDLGAVEESRVTGRAPNRRTIVQMYNRDFSLTVAAGLLNNLVKWQRQRDMELCDLSLEELSRLLNSIASEAEKKGYAIEWSLNKSGRVKASLRTSKSIRSAIDDSFKNPLFLDFIIFEKIKESSAYTFIKKRLKHSPSR